MRGTLAFILSLALATVACGPTVDLKQHLSVSDVASGYHDAGIVNGQNRLVPTLSFKLTNGSDQPLPVLQVNALFKRTGEQDEWGSGFLSVSDSDGLAPGATTDVITVTSNLGYTGSEPRAEMLQNRYFVDTRVELFAKYSSTQWVLLGEFPITRELRASSAASTPSAP
ncbi:MAG: hypothetical protein AB7F99_07995 [Vicinamibacterales bacterium]